MTYRLFGMWKFYIVCILPLNICHAFLFWGSWPASNACYPVGWNLQLQRCRLKTFYWSTPQIFDFVRDPPHFKVLPTPLTFRTTKMPIIIIIIMITSSTIVASRIYFYDSRKCIQFCGSTSFDFLVCVTSSSILYFSNGNMSQSEL